MRRGLRTKKRVKVRTPGGKLVWKFKKRKPSHTKCGKCGKKLNRLRLSPDQFKKLCRTERRPERPFPELCPRCMREELKKRVR